MKLMQNVPMQSTSRRPAVSLDNATLDKSEKKNALNPKAANGKAVAVPRCRGQFTAADTVSKDMPERLDILPILMDPMKAAAPPAPVRKEKKHNAGIGTEPAPLRYADSSHKPTRCNLR